MKKFMLTHSSLLKNISHWSIFILAIIALVTCIADVSAQQTLDIIKIHPELAQSSLLVKVGYLPSFK